MGNQLSGPEKVYKAAKGNNIYELQVRAFARSWQRAAPRVTRAARVVRQSGCDLQELCQRIAQANFEEPVRKTYFEWKDGDGRTPLLLAASKNYHNIAKLVSCASDWLV